MSKALSSYPKAERPRVIERRLQAGVKDESQRGNGYHAALDAAPKLGIHIPSKSPNAGTTKPRRRRNKNNSEGI